MEKGQTVTILTSASTHPQTLAMAQIAAQSAGAIVNSLDLLPQKCYTSDKIVLTVEASGPMAGRHRGALDRSSCLPYDPASNSTIVLPVWIVRPVRLNLKA